MLCDGVIDRTRIVIPSTPLAVRQAVCALFDNTFAGQMSEEARHTAQLVLAEALNNIVEHAYAQGPGEIEVSIEWCPVGLTCRIMDAGIPMPGGNLPEGKMVQIAPGTDLPEGGYGWHLIRTLSQDLQYRREGDRNLLSFRIAAPQRPHRPPVVRI